MEAIASKSPKELTELLEKIAGSDELREEYEKLLSEKEKAEENTIFSFKKKKGINAEKNQYREQKDEAEKCQKLLEKLVSCLAPCVVTLAVLMQGRIS